MHDIKQATVKALPQILDWIDAENARRAVSHGKQIRILSNGVLPPDVISHAAPGGDRSARYSVKARACEVTIEYEWGEPAFQRG